MQTSQANEEYDVIIVGMGPVGATLAHLLGLQGIETLVLEREASHYHLPRAVHFDDEIMRVFQSIGIAEPILPKLRRNIGMRFVAPNGKLLLDWPRPQEISALGWYPSYRMHQPDLEEELRRQLELRKSVTVRTQCDVFEIDESPSCVDLRYRELENEKVHQVRARYVVGCDGARSFVRSCIDTGMEDYGFHERWLVIDVLLKQDKPELGDHSIQYCNPERPATYVRGPLNRRRWEITVLPDEASEEIVKEPEVWKLLAKWLTPDEAILERSAVYTFHSLIAEKWRKGRLLIAGDSAHQTPPFMGQGMCAGIRDVANLGWKLAEVISGNAPEALLDTYQSERHPNAREYITTAVRLGGLINAADSETALRAAMPKPDGSAAMKSIYPPLGPGLGRGPNAGKMFGQPRLGNGQRMDDAFGAKPMIVGYRSLLQDLQIPEGLAVLVAEDTIDANEHLAAFDTNAVLLRPDKYILASASSAAEIAAFLPFWQGAQFK